MNAENKKRVMELRWDIEKNLPFKLSDVTHGSNKSYYWKCENDSGHTWESSPKDLAINCQFCVPKYIAPKGKSLADLFPEIAREIVSNKISGEELLPQSNKILTWKCKEGHEWEASVQARTKGKKDCPFCIDLGIITSSKRRTEKHNLQSLFPEIALELNPKLNNGKEAKDFSPYTNKLITWQCSFNQTHKWKALIANRTRLNSGCPFCKGQSSKPELRVLCELSSIFIDAVHREKIGGIEADVFLPCIRVAIEYDGAYWHASKFDADKKKNEDLFLLGFTVIRIREAPLEKVSPHDIVIPQSGLTKKTIALLLTVIKNLFVNNIDQSLAEAIDVYLLEKDFVNQSVWDELVKNPDKPPASRSLASSKLLCSEWDFEKNGDLKPTDIYLNSNRFVWFKCPTCKKSYKQRPVKRNQNSSGCKSCAMSYRSENLLRIKAPDLFSQLSKEFNRDIDIENIAFQSNKKLTWICPQDSSHTWVSTVSHRFLGTGCPVCSNKIVSEKNSIALTNPDLLTYWVTEKNLTLPTQITAGTGKKYWWRCKKDNLHIFQAIPMYLIKHPNACPICNGKIVTSHTNLFSKKPELRNEWSYKKNIGIDPENCAPQSGKLVWWNCSSDNTHEWQMSIQKRYLGRGCPHCRKNNC